MLSLSLFAPQNWRQPGTPDCKKLQLRLCFSRIESDLRAFRFIPKQMALSKLNLRGGGRQMYQALITLKRDSSLVSRVDRDTETFLFSKREREKQNTERELSVIGGTSVSLAHSLSLQKMDRLPRAIWPDDGGCFFRFLSSSPLPLSLS